MVTQNLTYCNNYTDVANPCTQSTKYTAMTLKEVHMRTTLRQTDLYHVKMTYPSPLHKTKCTKPTYSLSKKFLLGSDYLRNIHGYYFLQK